jgi:predicted RNase H-like nuclease (RuvC/YqgF family)
MASQYHKLSKVFALLANSNPKLNIWDRMCIHQTVNEYFMENENKNHMYENRIKELEYKLGTQLDNKIEQLTNELDNLKKNSCSCICSCRQ